MAEIKKTVCNAAGWALGSVYKTLEEVSLWFGLPEAVERLLIELIIRGLPGGGELCGGWPDGRDNDQEQRRGTRDL
jgi:hypothetical protein